MRKTHLDHFKSEWEYENDGEAILRAAREGFFDLPAPLELHISVVEIMEELEIWATFNRDEIGKILDARIYGEDNLFEKMLKVEFMHERDPYAHNIQPLPGADEKRMEIIRKRYGDVLRRVLDFCGESYQKGVYKERKPKSWVNRVVDRVKSVLK